MAITAGGKKYRQMLHKILSFQLQLPLLHTNSFPG